ncbi:MAG: nitrilase-related carbon-nitrogen hydrolase [Elusimicrobiota bacterium]
MPRIVRCGLIQASCDWSPEKHSLADIKKKMVAKHLKLIDKAGKNKVKILCLQEIFSTPYFCAEQDIKWYEAAEPIPGPTTNLLRKYAKKYGMVIIVPIYETPAPGIYYNTAAVIDADGKLLGIYRKNHIPHLVPGFYEKFYFKPGNLGYPTFQTRYARIGVYICYDRHFPDGARALGLNGAEIVFNPSATVAGISEHLWKLEQPAMAVANQFYVGAINRVGWEKPWRTGMFYGQSYFCDPRGQMVAMGPRDKDALVATDLDLDKILEVRNLWQFYRDRRPETYKELCELLP